MVPSRLIACARDPICIAIYAALDHRQGDRGRPWRGIRKLADELGVQPRTIETHLDHLAADGWITIVREGQHAAVITIVANPARWPERPSPTVRTRSARARSRSVYAASDSGARNAPPTSQDSGAKNAPPATSSLARKTRQTTREKRATETTDCDVNIAPRPRSNRSGNRSEQVSRSTCEQCGSREPCGCPFVLASGEQARPATAPRSSLLPPQPTLAERTCVACGTDTWRYMNPGGWTDRGPLCPPCAKGQPRRSQSVETPERTAGPRSVLPDQDISADRPERRHDLVATTCDHCERNVNRHVVPFWDDASRLCADCCVTLAAQFDADTGWPPETAAQAS